MQFCFVLKTILDNIKSKNLKAMYRAILASKWYDLNDVLKRERDPDRIRADGSNWKQFKYPFEHLVFSGGGIRGYSYCGGLKVTTKTNIVKATQQKHPRE